MTVESIRKVSRTANEQNTSVLFSSKGSASAFVPDNASASVPPKKRGQGSKVGHLMKLKE